MHRNWADDDEADGAWMDEETSYSSYYALSPAHVSHPATYDATSWSEAEAVQSIHNDIGAWYRRFGRPHRPSLGDEIDVDILYQQRKHDAWQRIVAKFDQVTRYMATPPPTKPAPRRLSVTSSNTPRPSTTDSDAPEANWAGIWYLLGDVEEDRNRRLGQTPSEASMPGDAYVLLQIWSCLGSRDFATVAGVCSDWYRLVYHSKLGQQRWQQIVRRRWKRVPFEDPVVVALCPELDWRKRFIALHRVASNWRRGHHTHETTALPNAFTARCLELTGPTQGVVGDARGVLRFLDASRGVVSEYRAHSYSVSAMAASGPSSPSHVVSGSVDGLVVLHDVARMAAVARLAAHLDAVSSIEFLSPTFVLTAAMDATVRLWDTRSDAPPLVFEDPLRREGALRATGVPDAPSFYKFAADGECSLWDLRRTTEPVRTLTEPIVAAASCWLANRTCVVLEPSGNATLLRNSKVSAAITRPLNRGRPLGCFRVELDDDLLVLASANAVDVYRYPTTLLYSIETPTSLRATGLSRTTVVGIDAAHGVHTLDFALR
ncbi:hypothetical protein ACHHYP_11914 [Achlya hypogyna]|uniref:Uncharacterized protein n=1 Tax=Achlya hypogyna TaxID=1202772 RepID=A0A1V9YI06_ACHHY|nr:hypothetical protein ACHHYP_11914 [Achlya hypogyna]